MDEREIDALERRVAVWSRQIDAVERILERAGPRQRELHQKGLKDLYERRRQARERLAALRLREAESWRQEDLQAGLFHIFDNLGRRIGRLLRRDR